MTTLAVGAAIAAALVIGLIVGFTVGERHTASRYEYRIAELEDAENVRRRDMRGQANQDFYDKFGSTR